MTAILTSNNLTEEDRYNAKRLVEFLKNRKQKGLPPITQKDILSLVTNKKYTEHSLSALINYARLELDEWLISSNAGLTIAETTEEKRIFIEYQKSITLPRLETLKWAEHKLQKEINKQIEMELR